MLITYCTVSRGGGSRIEAAQVRHTIAHYMDQSERPPTLGGTSLLLELHVLYFKYVHANMDRDIFCKGSRSYLMKAVTSLRLLHRSCTGNHPVGAIIVASLRPTAVQSARGVHYKRSLRGPRMGAPTPPPKWA